MRRHARARESIYNMHLLQRYCASILTGSAENKELAVIERVWNIDDLVA